MTWLRYLFDRIGARVEPFCQYDWQDLHDCEKCSRITARNRRIADYRLSKRLPNARSL
jgi:hypothetical protein